MSYGNTVALEQSIDKAYLTTTSKLVDLMKTKFGFWDHLDAFKKYILLGQGDFIAILMESIGDSLDRPANSLYRHNLTATLESAIRSSNAQYSPPEILRRLDARMLELSHGEIGWDVFTLEYKVDAPLDVIVTPHSAKEYLKAPPLPSRTFSRVSSGLTAGFQFSLESEESRVCDYGGLEEAGYWRTGSVKGG